MVSQSSGSHGDSISSSQKKIEKEIGRRGRRRRVLHADQHHPDPDHREHRDHVFLHRNRSFHLLKLGGMGRRVRSLLLVHHSSDDRIRRSGKCQKPNLTNLTELT